jgi:putative peptidoglycan lipid II flippase
MLPALFGVSVSQINLLIDTMIATVLVSGSVSWLDQHQSKNPMQI